MSARRRPAPRPRRGPAPARPTGPQRGALRVVAGELGGRRLDAPAGESTRPTSDRVRQALFNALDSIGAVDDARVLDAFAGSGALGIEALSRGAAHATFAEVDGQARQVVEANVASLGLEARSRVLASPAERVAAGGGPFDLVLLDPPYAYDRWEELLEGLVPALAPAATVVIESDREVPLPAGLVATRCRSYGGTVVTFATPAGAPQ